MMDYLVILTVNDWYVQGEKEVEMITRRYDKTYMNQTIDNTRIQFIFFWKIKKINCNY